MFREVERTHEEAVVAYLQYNGLPVTGWGKQGAELHS
jgi:hypothetical protein